MWFLLLRPLAPAFFFSELLCPSPGGPHPQAAVNSSSPVLSTLRPFHGRVVLPVTALCKERTCVATALRNRTTVPTSYEMLPLWPDKRRQIELNILECCSHADSHVRSAKGRAIRSAAAWGCPTARANCGHVMAWTSLEMGASGPS